MLELYLDENCILLNPKINDNFELLTIMSNLLEEQGYVTDNFQKKVIERERDFPTGLPTEKIGFAIPHADAQYVKESVLCIAILDEPIKFYRMDDDSSELDITVVIMIAMKNPNEQLKIFESLIDSLNNFEDWLNIKNASNVKESFERLSNLFQRFSQN